MSDPALTQVTDYTLNGWTHPETPEKQARHYCEILESGKILFFNEPPFSFAETDRQFLLAQKWAELRLHKNVSYRPSDDAFRGASGDGETVERLHGIMRNYSRQVLDFLAKFLSPYAKQWILDFSSFRPIEEQGRDLPLHKRNDLLHVDAFPSRPTRGGRILRVFTNLNPSKSRVWETTGPFEKLAREYAEDAGLKQFAESGPISKTVQNWGQKLGIRGMGRTPYDKFMLRFHDYLKENAAFQANFPKDRLEFPPLATWLIYTDGVAHAAASGQYAIEQTLIIPPAALVAPESAPYRILENIAGRSLVT
jgi:hypothetical protein